MKRNNPHEDLALRQILNEQAQRAEQMDLPEKLTEQIMGRIMETEKKEEKPALLSRMSFISKVAAVFVVAIVVSGLAYAAFRLTGSGMFGTSSSSVETNSEVVSVDSDHLVNFDNTPLDSVLHVVAGHYGKVLSFRDNTTDTLRLSTVWDKSKTLDAFVEILNEFDGISITNSSDTIFVESVKVEK